MGFQQYKDWYRDHGTRNALSLLNVDPRPVKNLPQGSTLHYLGSKEAPLPDVSDPLYLGYSTKIELHSILEYNGETEPHGSRTMTTATKQSMDFASKSKIFHYLKTLNISTVGPTQLLVVNYGFLDEIYRYPQVRQSEYYRFRNKLQTFVSTMKFLNNEKPRQNFLVLNIPQELVGRNTLDMRSLGKPKQVADIFNTEEKIVLREIWLWCNPDTRDHSVFGSLNETDMRHLNIMFRTYTGEYTIVSFSYMFSWMKGNGNYTMSSAVMQVSFVELQKYWLKYLMVLQTINANGASLAEQEKAAAQAAAEAERAADQEGDTKEDPKATKPQEERFSEVPAEGHSGLGGGLPGDRSDTATSKATAGDTLETEIDVAQQLKELDADIDALDALDKKRFESKFVVKKTPDGEELIDVKDVTPDTYSSDIPESTESISAKIFKAKTAKDALLEKIEAAADEKRISVSDYRKLTEQAKKSDQAPDPFGSDKTIAEAMKIDPGELEITEQESRLDVPPVVLDPSMAGAPLSVMDRKYNTKIIYKDVLRSVQAIQKAGVIIRRHEVVTQYSEMGTYDIHTIELKPVNGNPSIIRARIPRVDEEGIFVVRGVRYIARSQMVDKPIRRIGTNRVGLTSYYGKSFVDRATKKADSYLETIIRRLNRGTIEPDQNIRDVSPGDVFDNYFEAPYIYNGLASKFRSFRTGPYLLNLNYKDREKAATPEVLAKLEVKGRRLIGQGPGSRPLVVDMDNQFFLVGPDGEQAVGDIFDIMGMDRLNAPVDFAEVKVFSKSIAVGVFIGYNLGFRALVKYLGARHRLVEGRQQKKLQPYEYVVQFKDVAYIFDRRDKAASLVLAGYRSFDKETRSYDAIEFDSKPVYTRLLESRGLTSIYLKEMENLVDMFVDPITEDLLKELNEPQTFMGLLVRSCELLDTFHHPASQDMNNQRVRGYERFAGFMYKEMANAVRAFKAKNSTGRAKVDMSPFAVWSLVTRDNSVKQAEDINPIQALKGSEAVTYVGEGGRSKESMNKASRALHTSNLGVISVDGSVDSSDVGINIFTSANPGFNSVRGMSRKGRPTGPANLMGTSSMLAPFAANDD